MVLIGASLPPMRRPVRHKVQNKSPSGNHQELPINILGLSLVCATPMLLGFLYGYDIGATSFVLQLLLSKGEESSIHEDYDDGNFVLEDLSASFDSVWWSNPMTSLQQGLFVSALSLGALIGSHLMLVSPACKSMGRRMELRVAAGLYITGTLINVVGSGTLLRSNNIGFYALLLGRTLFGIGVGFVMHGAPAYLAEMCPPSIRGAIVSAKETVIVGGIVVGYTIGNLHSHLHSTDTWTHIYAWKLLLELPLFALTFYIPRSKRWLLLHGYRQEAEESMRFIYVSNRRNSFDTGSDFEDSDNISLAFAELAKQVEDTMGSALDQDTSSISKMVGSSEYRSALLASMGLILFQQVSGQPSLLSYTTVLLNTAGWDGNASVLTSILMMAVSTSTVLFVDRVGRRPLLKLCCGVMMAASFVLCISFWYLADDLDTELSPSTRNVVLVAVCLYIGGYQIGFGPVTWCIVSEVFPLEIKGTAIALGVELNYLLNFFVQFLLPMIQVSVGWNLCFLIFACVLGFAYYFVDRCVPETRGLTLEQIQLKLSERIGSKSDLLQENEAPLETTRLMVSR